MELPISLDPRDPTPLHAQLERAIRVAIATGKLVPAAQLPTVRQLAVDLRVNANTVARVYLALEREGVLVTKRGVGTFIAEAQPRRAQAAHRSHRDKQLNAIADRFLTDAAALGITAVEALRHLERRVQEGE